MGELHSGAHIAVIGGGFIGAEAATSLTKRGFRVSVLESAPAPLRGPLGDTVAQWLIDLPSEFGVDLHTNVVVHDVRESTAGAVIESNEGPITASAVVVGVGADQIGKRAAHAAEQLARALERGERYREAGADVVFIEAPVGLEQVERVVRNIFADMPSGAYLCKITNAAK